MMTNRFRQALWLIFIIAAGGFCDTSFYVSIAGNDGNDGSLNAPFASLEKARDAIRQLKAPKGAVTVYLRGGIYILNQPLVLGPEDSGTLFSPVTWTAYDGETPVLSGGVSLQPAWKKTSSGILKAAIGTNRNFRQLYMNGRKAVRARTPNAGSFLQFETDKQSDGFNIKSGLIDASADLSGVEIAAKCKWMHKRLQIDSVYAAGEYQRAVIDAAQWDLILNGPQGVRRYKGEDYWLENSLTFLDQPGEWYYSTKSGTLYYYPRPDEQTSSLDTVIPVLPTLISLEGSLDEPVSDIAFKGLTFRHTGWADPNQHGFIDVQANTLLPQKENDRKDPQYRHQQQKARIPAALQIHSGSQIQVESCTFEQLGGTGLTFNDGGEDNRIVSSSFRDIAASAIEIGNDVYRPDHPAMWPRRYLVFNNLIQGIGTEYFGSLGIKLFYVDQALISHNTISDIPYSGIDAGWGWFANEIVLQARNIRIEHNRVENYLNELIDGAGIYSANPVFGSVIRENYVKDMKSSHPDPAVYNDGCGAYWWIESNVVEHANRLLGQQSWGGQRKRDIAASGNYSTTSEVSIFGVNRTVADTHLYPDADWPEPARKIIENAGVTDASAPELLRESDSVITVDNQDSGFSTDPGGWETGMQIMAKRKGFFGEDYAYTGEGSLFEPKWARWTPDIEEDGDYHIYIRYSVGVAGAEYVPVEIVSNGGKDRFRKFTYDQRNPVYDNEWISLGRYHLSAGSNNYVKLYASGAGITVADAVKFVRLNSSTDSNRRALNLEEQLQPVPASAQFGEEGFHVWGASAVRGPDGKYHLFYSRWPTTTGFQSWVTHSEIAHAVADHPGGPYHPVDVALPVRADHFWDAHVTHNPTVHRFGDKYYLYYMGNRGDQRVVEQFNNLNWLHRNNQRIGVAIADDPAGPWKRLDYPVIDVSEDELCVSNPSVTEMRDGRYLMVYKSVKKDKPLPFGGPVVHRVAIADRPEGPFVKTGQDVFTAAGSDFPAEDPYIWFDHRRNRYYAIVKDQGGHFTDAGRSLALFCSDNGLDWQPEEHALVTQNRIQWQDREQPIFRLERPQLLLENGQPSVLFLSVLEKKDSKESYNVHVPVCNGTARGSY
jgi:hypothetical protein